MPADVIYATTSCGCTVNTSVPPNTAEKASLPALNKLTYGSNLEYVRNDVSENTGTRLYFSWPYALAKVCHNTRNARNFAISKKKCVSIAKRTKNLFSN